MPPTTTERIIQPVMTPAWTAPTPPARTTRLTRKPYRPTRPPSPSGNVTPISASPKTTTTTLPPSKFISYVYLVSKVNTQFLAS